MCKNGLERAAQNLIEKILSQRNLDDLFLFYISNLVPRYHFLVTCGDENQNYVILVMPNPEDVA